uniref:ATP synthase F0 subunit 8 n=1 Tax=Haliclystus sanjuanensis TaxID=168739 RepID=G9ISQ8_9CNID|nr:ATP synthase F0 subunit 8 [Haliclystus sanjuanensis]
MPQLDLITFFFQFSGILIGLGLLMGLLLWSTLPGLKISLRARQVGVQTSSLELTDREAIYKQTLQQC